jgi:hypothetical protein
MKKIVKKGSNFLKSFEDYKSKYFPNDDTEKKKFLESSAELAMDSAQKSLAKLKLALGSKG